MESKKDFKLMEGDYMPSDAKNLLFGLINGKIGFHNLEIMRSLENSDGNLSNCNQDLKELKRSKEQISTLLQAAGARGMKVQLRGNLEIFVQG